MLSQEFFDYFQKRKQEFLKDRGRNNYEKILNRFGKWLEKERIRECSAKKTGDFDDFADGVLVQTEKMLSVLGIKIIYTPPDRRMGFKESWRCIQVFENKKVYYRLGKTRLRKRAPQGQNILLFELVMDGQKKKIFLPLLNLKKEMEIEFGETIERELPSVERTGKYRLKVFMPFYVVERWDVRLVSVKLAKFILITKKALNRLGIV